MTASVESLSGGIAEYLVKAADAQFWPIVAEGVLDFDADGQTFRVLVLGEADTIEGIEVHRSRDITPEEEEQILTAQALALEAEDNAEGNGD
jgi:hypothetical protein